MCCGYIKESWFKKKYISKSASLIIALCYQVFKGISKQRLAAPEAGPEKWKSRVLHSPGEHKSFSTQALP